MSEGCRDKRHMTRQKLDDRGEVILYRIKDGRTALDVRLAGETVWLTQAQIADLFAVNVPAISRHIKNIYADRELSRKATVSKMETVRMEGKRQVTRTVEFYNLGWRVRGFADGNKRIGSFLCILFLRENGYLEDATGQVKINDNALVALALLIVESEPRNKGLLIRLVMNPLVEQPLDKTRRERQRI